jgi:hypothetical protein
MTSPHGAWKPFGCGVGVHIQVFVNSCSCLKHCSQIGVYASKQPNKHAPSLGGGHKIGVARTRMYHGRSSNGKMPSFLWVVVVKFAVFM